MMKFNFSSLFLFTIIISTPPSYAESLREMSELGGECIETDGSLSCGEGDLALHIIDGTQSPANAAFAVGWRAPEREDWLFAELYLVRLSNGKAIQPLKAKVEWVSKTQLANHQSVFASWMGNKPNTGGGFMVGVNGKWNTQSLEMYQWAGEDALTFEGEVLPKIGEALYNKLYEDNPDVDLGGYVLSTTEAPLIGPTEHKQSTKPFTVIFTAVFQEPKASTPIYEYEVEVKLEGYKSWSQPVMTSIRPLETN
ncbi:MAG: hypothetical protein ABJO30_06105 [Hyphomicrobiales bacterium]